ncbi:hypothetical protein [Hyunsoonleella pacifica]|uniref:Uncharacterized protein n=1 Tax=Hyunsoonleella pacifica TaxID=1080224 RepID=A0A4V6MT89_9FLAO|nr:hypothetical protein [Hyunsoonleella pacifica]TBN17598.1 hypothetical protein EYD46_04595 [Hyunsoonleella pacifica]GGD10530.1 hypothetical protein GCM10011368_10660 [Hyunsoonleella pacifica]
MFLLNIHPSKIPLLISQSQIVTVLSIVVVFFLVLLILGVRKSYILKKENDQLAKSGPLQSDDDNKAYKDFRDGHLYDNN